MFSDETLDVVEFKSTWKKERSLSEQGVQTRELSMGDVAVQSIKRKHKQIQTDEDIEEDIQLYDDDSPELYEFLRRASDMMIREIKYNNRSHAFDGYDVNWGEQSDAVDIVHTLSHPDIAGLLHITGLSWNSTGSVIAAAYGRLDHEDWCTHKSALCTWNLDRRNLDPLKPDSVIDVPSCLMCISCHPKKPSWVAGGTFDGEVVVWDTSQTEENLVATSGIGDDSHREPVSKVHWIPDPESKGKKYHVVSVSGDGRILVWRMSSHKQKLKLHNGFVLLTESLPRHLRVRSHGNLEMGVGCISYSRDDDTTFLVGSESGGIFKCSTNTHGSPSTREIACSVDLRSPVTFTFSPHHGPVYAVECSPHHRNVFLSSATDTTIRIYSMLQASPLITFEPGAGYVYSAKWSPARPLVFAAVTESGMLYFYDLKQNRAAPVLKLEANVKKLPIYSLQFNSHNKSLLATGDGGGCVQIWRLSNDMVQQTTRETEMLDEISGKALQ